MQINTLVWEKNPQSKPATWFCISPYLKETIAVREQTEKKPKGLTLIPAQKFLYCSSIKWELAWCSSRSEETKLSAVYVKNEDNYSKAGSGLRESSCGIHTQTSLAFCSWGLSLLKALLILSAVILLSRIWRLNKSLKANPADFNQFIDSKL